MREYALIVAGGSGTRMESSTPKQFLELAGMPVLMHTIKAFYSYSSRATIIVVLPSDQIERWHGLCLKHGFDIPHKTAHGGVTRFQSVRNGLKLIVEDEAMVAIHDGVRPLVTKEMIGASFRLAASQGSAVAAVPLKESLRKTDRENSFAIDRSEFMLVQTPQTFKYQLIKHAYNIPENSSITDDATVAEKSGIKISLFAGEYDNIKITTPIDLKIAAAILEERIKKAEHGGSARQV